MKVIALDVHRVSLIRYMRVDFWTTSTCPYQLGNPRSINIVADLCSLFASVQEMIPVVKTACHIIDTILNPRCLT